MHNVRQALTGLTLAIMAVLSIQACTRLTPQEQIHYSTRVYTLPYEQVFDAVKTRIEQYPMGLGKTEHERGILQSRIGGTTPGFGANVGYQILVSVTPERDKTRVTPTWKMNVSSEPTTTHLVPVGIDERPLFYVEFFDGLDAILSGSAKQEGS